MCALLYIHAQSGKAYIRYIGILGVETEMGNESTKLYISICCGGIDEVSWTLAKCSITQLHVQPFLFYFATGKYTAQITLTPTILL